MLGIITSAINYIGMMHPQTTDALVAVVSLNHLETFIAQCVGDESSRACAVFHYEYFHHFRR